MSAVIPPISGVSGIGAVATVTPTAPTSSVGGTDTSFGTALTHGIDSLQRTQSTADNLATQASTGSLADVTSYMIASNEANLATQLTTAVRDKAVAAFTSIMNMQM